MVGCPPKSDVLSTSAVHAHRRSRTAIALAAALMGLPASASWAQATSGAQQTETPQGSEATLPPQPPVASPRFLIDRLAAGISFGWLSSESLRYLARIHFDFPFFVAQQKGIYVRGSLSSSISRIESAKIFRFQVEDVDYLFEAGTRDYLSSRVAVAAFVGQQGSENLDRPGSAWVRYVGLGAQSATFPRPGGGSRLDWNLNIGGVFQRQGIGGDWVARGDVLWDALRLRRSAVGADMSFDSLIFSRAWHSDWWLGPRWSFDLANGIRASLFAHYLHSGNPLGVGASGVQIGLNYAEGAYSGPREGTFPDVRGVLAAGFGKHRSPGTFDLQADFPPFLIKSRNALSFVDVDAETYVGSGPDNVLYKLTGGLEVELTPAIVAGGYLRHRSYHLLAQNGSSRDINLLQTGLRSRGWDFSDRAPGHLLASPPARWPGAIAWSLGAAYVLSSSLVEEPRWIGDAGFRWDGPAARGCHPYLLASTDAGEVSQARAAVGLILPTDMTLSAEYRRDTLLRGQKDQLVLVLSLYY